MTLSNIEVMAIIVVFLAAIKLITLIINPRIWLKIVKTVYGNRFLTPVVSLVLAVVVLRYLLAELSLAHIFAVMLFFMLIASISVSAYSKDMLALSEKLLKDRNIVMKAWLALLVWIVLIIWVLYSIFA